jgi:hypothetical protein
MAVAGARMRDADARAVDGARDRAGIFDLLVDVWREEDPYRSFDESLREEELGREVERSLERPQHASAANAPSVRWHLACGFALAPDPLREALRRDGVCREPYAGPSASS